MAFTVQDLSDLLALLRQHPEWRDAVRREVLTDELLGLPTAVARIAEGQDRLSSVVTRLAEDVGRFAATVDRLSDEMRELARVVLRQEGRMGNLEGWRYEQRFNARARVSQIVRRPVEINLSELDAVLDARDGGRLTQGEWKQLLAVDVLLRGLQGAGRDAPEVLVALEVSQVIDSRDVQRAHDRAAILSRIGLSSLAAVGGRRLTDDASVLADRLGVRTLIDTVDEDC